MTRQIARAILASTWLTLLAASMLTYFALRSVVVTELDQLLVERAALVLRGTGLAEDDPNRRVPESDRYLIRTDNGRTIARTPSARGEPVHPIIVSRGFARTPEDGRVRTLTLRWAPPSPGPGATIVYSTPARAYETALSALAGSLGIITLLGLLTTAWIARRVANRATLPLRQTADTVGEIDENNLARRIDPGSLPDELEPMGRRLNEMLERLESAFGRQKRFLVDAAHELRTPVAALRTSVEVALESRRDPAIMARSMQRCLNLARLLERLAGQLTEALRGEIATENRAFEPINVGRLVRDTAGTLEPLAHARGQTLMIASDDGPLISTDADRLRSIVVNLVANAIDYTPDGGRISVEASVTGGEWRMVVSDTGIGIAPEHQSRVFDAFFRVDGSRAREKGRTGLGLYLVKCHTDAIGGRIDLNSQAGVGTTITLSLPALTEGSRAWPTPDALVVSGPLESGEAGSSRWLQDRAV